nr:hypothetical protein [Amycolatopsis sulphurea]
MVGFLGFGELGFELGLALVKFGAFLVDVADEVLGRCVDTGEVADEVLDHSGCAVDLAAQRGEALLSFPLGSGAKVSDCAVEQVAAVGAEDVGREEFVELVDDRVFADPDTAGGWMSFGDVVLFRRADVVDDLVTTSFAVHAAAAGTPEQVGAQQVRAFGLGMFDVGVAGTAGTEAVSADALGCEPVFQGDERIVDRLRGPDPFLDGVGAVAAGLATLAVPHHVPGVFGVSEDVAHVRVGPAADGALRVDGHGRWVGRWIEVQPVCDRWTGLPPEGEVPAFSDARVRDLLSAARQAGLKPRTDAELLPLLLELIGAHIPVAAWPSLPKAARTEHAREVTQAAAAAAADRASVRAVHTVDNTGTPQPRRPRAPRLDPAPQPATGDTPAAGWTERARAGQQAVDADRRRRREEAVAAGPVSPPPRLGEAFRRRSLFLLADNDPDDNVGDTPAEHPESAS